MRWTLLIATGFVLVGLYELNCQLFTGNHSPVISELNVSDTLVDQWGEVDAVCYATDPDGDSLQFDWYCTGGSFNRTDRPGVTWYAPFDTGVCTLKATVTDGRGGEATKSRSIRVRLHEALNARAGPSEPWNLITGLRQPVLGVSEVTSDAAFID